LSEEVPLIFFDEFDAKLGDQEYGWLKYFLAPMQDGKFKGADTEVNYSVGKAIFVFAGGTAETFDAFGKCKDTGPKSEDAWKLVKEPDFISRLRGYLDIKGINKKDGENAVSNLLALRRAIILERKAKQIFDQPGKNARINKGLINAFLRVGKYEHGIRSMVAIVEMARPEHGQLQVASLPSRD
jgi:hypothetical protein